MARIGTYIANRPQPQSWDEFMRIAEETARKPKGKPRGSWAHLNPPGGWTPPKPEQRCQAIAASTGKQCGKFRLKGATRCPSHGGLRENPYHPAAGRAFANGTLQATADAKHAQRVVRERYTRQQAEDARRAIRAAGGQAHPLNVLAILEAWDRDQSGREARRFLAQIEAKSGGTKKGQAHG